MFLTKYVVALLLGSREVQQTFYIDSFINRAATTDNVSSGMRAERRFRSACAFALFDQNLYKANFG